MKRHYYLIMVLLLTIASCREKPLTINKFIYLRVYGIVYDSFEKPCLGIFPYYEYNKGHETKVAYGVHENGASVAFLNGLDSFYVMETDTKTIEIIK